MRANFARTIFITLLVLFLPFASIASTSWYRRWKASQLLACVSLFRPGATTETQAREALRPFSKYETQYEQPELDKPIQVAQYDFYNYPQWLVKLSAHLPDSWSGHLTFLPWTLFTIDIRYRDGLIAELNLREMQQEHPGYPHPTAASVQVLSTHFETQSGHLPDDFRGFSVHKTASQEFDGNGKPIGLECCGREFVTLDDRASQEQRLQSLNFQLHCLTSLSPCNEIRKIRPPISSSR
jgi:hypothetical protein